MRYPAEGEAVDLAEVARLAGRVKRLGESQKMTG
jgi:hypothetical protein